MNSILKGSLYFGLIFSMIFINSCSSKPKFDYSWAGVNDRVWAGSSFWANRLEDWNVKDGRIETVVTNINLPLRTLHILPVHIDEKEGNMEIRVRTGLVNQGDEISSGSLTGILLGAGGSNLDYKAASLIHHTSAPNAGILIGVTGSGKLHIKENAAIPKEDLADFGIPAFIRDCILKINVSPEENNTYQINIKLIDAQNNQMIDEFSLSDIQDNLIQGNIALVSHPGSGKKPANFWFREISIAGDKIEVNQENCFGPIAFSMYTLSDSILKVSAQMLPLGGKDQNSVELQIFRNSNWETIGTESFSYPSYNALFRIEQWDANEDVRYRIAYHLKEQGSEKNSYWDGVIRREPIDSDTLKTISIACVGHCMSGIDERGNLPGWTNWDYEVFENMRDVWTNDNLFTTENIWFPHAKLVNNLRIIDPDMIFFLGDQVYEFRPTKGEYENGETTIYDYLYKWYLWGWSFRDVLKDRPSISIPDDHDVYQGNIWGDGGRKSPAGDRWRDGGYTESPEFINMVQRTQTSNLPDPYDPTPADQGITVYYTEMNYAGVSFSILEDRKFKSRPTAKDKDLKLLGERQLDFLNVWGSNWKENTDFKVCLTQTLFAGVNTEYGTINKDYDTNGWPSSGRNKALEAIRKSFAFMIGGDQHLATVVHHGIDEWGDAGYSVIAQAIGCVYPRFWQPQAPPIEPDPSGKKFLGKYFDAFGNKIDVKAVANPYTTNIAPIAQNDLAVGYIEVDFVKSNRSIIMKNWPVTADHETANPQQYDGWPYTISLMDNYSRKAFGYLPNLTFENFTDPFIQVINEETNEIVYSLKVKGDKFNPAVFKDGYYSVRVGSSSENIYKTLTGLRPVLMNSDTKEDIIIIK